MLDCHIEKLFAAVHQHSLSCHAHRPTALPLSLPLLFLSLSTCRVYHIENLCRETFATRFPQCLPRRFGLFRNLGQNTLAREHHDVSAAAVSLSPSISISLSLSPCVSLFSLPFSPCLTAATKQNISKKYAINDILP